MINLPFNIGTTEIVIVAAILFFLFGGKKLPEFARGLGQASKEFKNALKDDDTPKKKSK